MDNIEVLRTFISSASYHEEFAHPAEPFIQTYIEEDPKAAVDFFKEFMQDDETTNMEKETLIRILGDTMSEVFIKAWIWVLNTEWKYYRDNEQYRYIIVDSLRGANYQQVLKMLKKWYADNTSTWVGNRLSFIIENIEYELTHA